MHQLSTERRNRPKLTTRLHLANKALLILASLLIVLVVNHLQKEQALKHAEQKSLLLLKHNLALHSYINNQLKPNLFTQTEPIRKPDFFDPVWMSSTYAVRSIDQLYRQMSDDNHYYKEAAINARSPENEADSFERAFIERLNREPALDKLTGVRTIDGKPFFYTMIRGEQMEQTCLRCHSQPAQAPEQLVARYGPKRSFNRADGELISAISVRIPLAEAYQAANQFSFKLSLALVALLVGMYYLQKWLLCRLVTTPLEQFQRRADEIANDPRQLGSQLPLETTHEMNAIANSFNIMSTRLKEFVDQLEQTVAQRTEELSESERKLRLLFENMTTGFAIHQMLYDPQGKPHDYRFIEINPAFENLTGLSAANVIGKTVLEVLPDTAPFWIESYGTVATKGTPLSFKQYAPDLKRHFQVWAFCPQPGYFATLFNDITDSVSLEQQLRQSQKLESIGRLAAGVAHEFNNKLMVIRGNAELAHLALPDVTKLKGRLDQIIDASEEAKNIIAQLLAFSRQQPIFPHTIDLNQVISNIHDSLTILIGEAVQMCFIPGQDIWTIFIDPIQIDQIVMNLALNARDAMPDGGLLTITTANLVVEQPTNQAAAGQYVVLSISDTGHGMDEETRQHLFEPFFTTKEVGKGTGLGLSTIYGIVTQNKGFIEVTSQPKQGTTFLIYLPRHHKPQ